jgi:hypothetical protein
MISRKLNDKKFYLENDFILNIVNYSSIKILLSKTKMPPSIFA